MTKADFDPTKTVLFEECNDRVSFPGEQASKQDFSSTSRILAYRPDEIILKVDSSTAGFLFLSEVFYPGWKASVDGERKEILRGNYLFRVIQVPEGSHLVRVFFDPLSIKVGVGVTFLTILILLTCSAALFLKKRR